MCACIALCTIVAYNIVQNRPDNFPCYPPDNHHCSDDVYLREGGFCRDMNSLRTGDVFPKVWTGDATDLVFQKSNNLELVGALSFSSPPYPSHTYYPAQ